MLLVLNLGNTPGVLSTLDTAAVGSGDILLGTNNGKRHGSDEGLSVSEGGFVVFFEGRRVDLDALGLDDVADLWGSECGEMQGKIENLLLI